jgi:hypothetical protein
MQVVKNMLRNFDLFLASKTKSVKSLRRKSKAQSMVEFAILLPILIMLFSGMVEFGFMLNTYLSLLDSTRQAARQFSNSTPFFLDTNTNTVVDDPNFYSDCALAVKDILAPPADPNARQIVLNSSSGDDVLVSVLSVTVDTNTNSITTIQRHPDGYQFYSLYNNQLTSYDDASIASYMTQNGTPPVQTGILIVEVYYGYKGVLHLPWLDMFMSTSSPIRLHASTVMPLVSAKP